MKPLTLLLTLFTLALVGAIVLIQSKPSGQPQTGSQLTPMPEAPLPIDTFEPVPPIPRPPLLESSFVPEAALTSFVEKHLNLTFAEPPIFVPVPAEEVIVTIEAGVTNILTPEQYHDLKVVSQGLGILPNFQELDQTIITILAGEIRGLITPSRNLILNDFQISSPPEQAALINLLAQRLLTQSIPFPKAGSTIDELLAHHYTVQTLALSTEREFRKTLPSYPPSLNENLRESILLGLPNFFHELSTFSEFHLLEKFQTSPPTRTLQTLSSASSHRLLAFPFKPQITLESNDLGAIPLYLILLEATDPTTARTLATSLISDELQVEDNIFTWTLRFSSEKTPPRIAELFRSYYSLRDPEKKLTILTEKATVKISTSK